MLKNGSSKHSTNDLDHGDVESVYLYMLLRSFINKRYRGRHPNFELIASHLPFHPMASQLATPTVEFPPLSLTHPMLGKHAQLRKGGIFLGSKFQISKSCVSC